MAGREGPQAPGPSKIFLPTLKVMRSCKIIFAARPATVMSAAQHLQLSSPFQVGLCPLGLILFFRLAVRVGGRGDFKPKRFSPGGGRVWVMFVCEEGSVHKNAMTGTQLEITPKSRG